MSETVEVRRDGSYLTIPAEAVDRYIARGFDVVDENDNVVIKSLPNDIGALKSICIKQEAEINSLKEQLTAANLRFKELSSSKQANIKVIPEKPVNEAKIADIDEITEAPKASRRKKKAE